MAVAEMAAAHPEHPLRVHCVQPVGNNTISGPLADGKEVAQSVECTTEISGLQVASVVDGNETIRACRSTGGTGILVDDQATWAVQQRLSEREGVFAEPAGSIAVAAALQAVEQGIASPDEPLVCLITGSGFKDPKSVQRMNQGRQCPLMNVDEIR